MADQNLTQQDLERIVAIVRSEVAALQFSDRLPPPNDVKLEEVLCSAALVSDVGGIELAGRDFYSRLHGMMFDLAGALRAEGLAVDVAAIAAALRDQGLIGPVEGELLWLRDNVPSLSRRDVEAAAERVLELKSRRALLAVLETVAGQLRADAMDYTEACQTLLAECNPTDGGGWSG